MKDLTVHEFYKKVLLTDRVTKNEAVEQFIELYQLYERVSSDRLNYIHLWEKVPVEQRLEITETLFDKPF